MVIKVRMPKIDANVLEGAIGEWIRQVGDWVEVGRPLVEIITDKATFELESEHAGFLRTQVAQQKSVVPVGYVIALLSESEDEPLPEVSGENDELMQRHLDAMLLGPEDSAALVAPAMGGSQAPVDERGSRVRATPAARKLARREGVRLEEVTPAGGKAIQERDVLQYVRQRGDAQQRGSAERQGQ